MKHHEKSAPGLPGLTRREFIWMSSASFAGVVMGCATNPVTGKSQLMLVSRNQEIAIDRQYAPRQFSADYGAIQDRALNAYIDRTGKRMAALTHRPDMPYSFRGVNAAYINAYAFPGGSIACTRGILLSLENEAELAALLGHELGHVNARHSAEQMSKSQAANLGVGLLTAAVGYKYEKYAWIASSLGMIGAGALLARYSRDNEREADDLGMAYMVKAEYSPEGMVGLMDMLKNLSGKKPGAVDLMFSTHPWSGERYNTSVAAARSRYGYAEKYGVYRERYMDNTARLRERKAAVEDMQKGEAAMGQKKYDQAESLFKSALKKAPNDYAGLLLLSKCLLTQEKFREAGRYAADAKQAYPREAQAYHVAGFAKMKNRNFDAALRDFSSYDQMLPGNPAVTFFKGYCYEGMGRREEAATQYAEYLEAVSEGEYAAHAQQRLTEWGYVKSD